MAKKDDESPQSDTSRPMVEWIIGVLSGIVIVALIVFLLYQALFKDARPADLSVVIEGVEQSENGTTVKIAVANSGDRAAATVRVHAIRTDASTIAMHKEIEFDYVAGHVIRRGAFVFSDASILPADLAIEIGGYAEP